MPDLRDLASYLTSEPYLHGLYITTLLTVVSMSLAIVLGWLLAAVRLSRLRVVELLVMGYVWFFRGVPVLLLLIFIYAGLPQVGIRFPPLICAIIALCLNESAYMAEIARSGLQAISKEQAIAARVLGLKRWQAFGYVVLPQAVKITLPPTGNQIITMVKNTSLVSVVAVGDIMLNAQRTAAANFDYIGALAAAAIYYLALVTVITWLVARMESSMGHQAPPPERRSAARRSDAGRRQFIRSKDANHV